MLTNALTTTLALALAIPGGVLAIDAANDNAVPGINTSEFFREHGAAFGRGHGGGHVTDHHQTHADGHGKGHGHDANHTYMAHNGTHGQHGGHGQATHDSRHGADRSVHLVARCLASDNHTTEDCVQLAGRLANATVSAVAACMDEEEPRRCYAEQDGPKSHHAARIAHCIEENGTEPCAEKLADHLLCHGARLAGVESPVDCPVPERNRDDDTQVSSDDDDSTDTTTSTDQA